MSDRLSTLDFLTTEVVPYLVPGLWQSLWVIVPSAVLGLLGGVLVGVIRAFGPPGLARPANVYVAVFRGSPLVVQLLMWYYGLPHIGIALTGYQAAVMGFALCSAAYHSEYVRGGLLSIRRGQLLAAQALGFTPLKAIISIILPQAIRRALPGCGNEVIYLIKYSSLAYLVTVMELTGQAKKAASYSFRYTEVFLAVGCVYLLLVTVATFLLHRLEKRLQLPGFGGGE